MKDCTRIPPCQSSSAALCHLIQYGETSRQADPRCGCRCHEVSGYARMEDAGRPYCHLAGGSIPAESSGRQATLIDSPGR